MQSVFGMHNPTRVKAFCYATTASDGSIHRQQIEREAPVFRDVSTLSPDKLVQQIVQDKIHILVNLNGYTRGARNEIFAARPAPIQMSFMGFAGTLGAEWCDYLLADATAIPPSTLRPHRSNLTLGDVFRDEVDAEAEDWIYSENIIFCRDTFFCCDHAQSADGHNERDLTWDEDQRRRWKMRKDLFPNLPDDAILLGNFNQLYKVCLWPSEDAGSASTDTSRLTQPLSDLGCASLRLHPRHTSGSFASPNWAKPTFGAPHATGVARASPAALSSPTWRPNCNTFRVRASVISFSTPRSATPTQQPLTYFGPTRRC